mmetsp:Transcript_21330/g.43138  ORF Transcript_21330/g.43138 Transcript_21330/m.43138 type:complete len:193 (-) Transcript_21330:438-1016(-)
MMFPQPWTATTAVPHPMSGLSNTAPKDDLVRTLNFASYGLVDQAMWLGNMNMVNAWRRRVLNLAPVRTGVLGGFLLSRAHVPFSYMWSAALLPKPDDWPEHTRVVGTFTAGTGSNTATSTDRPAQVDETPFASLLTWLGAGEAPIFVGFGSMVIDAPDLLSAMVREAARTSGRRVLVQSGWSKLSMATVDSS